MIDLLVFVGILVGSAAADGARVERVMKELDASRAKHHVSGASVAIVHGGKVAWAAGLGLKRAGGEERVDADTLFQAASISKPVAAVAALRLVERGEIELDRDVNDYLVSWKVPTAVVAGGEKVTLRRLLSHMAGLGVHGFPGYFSDQPIPELLDVLDGREPANTPPIRIEQKPGWQWRYSGGGYCVLQQMLLDGAELEFPQLMKELVLEPLEMTCSTYAQPLPQELRENVAIGHLYPPPRPLRGDGFVTHPELAAAGLWTTGRDLARFVVAVQEAHAGRRPEFLKQETARAFLEPQTERAIPDSGGARAGLGIMVFGSDEHPRFRHGGANAGFRCELVAYRDDGLAAVVMTNSDQGEDFIDVALDLIAREYEWPDWIKRDT
jgi:CubicO group peptidase (beta-lactamase class C family)